ncbi:PspC domain-containing protein [Guggenheimella bovis]
MTLKKSHDKMISGVLGGFATHYNIDPTLLRIIYAILLVIRPFFFVVVYFIVDMIMPAADDRSEYEIVGEEVVEPGRSSKKTMGLIFAGLGCYLIVRSLGFDMTLVLSVALLGFGIYLFTTDEK